MGNITGRRGTAAENSDFDKNTNSKHIVTYITYIDGVTLSQCVEGHNVEQNTSFSGLRIFTGNVL